jgi:hypothetical protein
VLLGLDNNYKVEILFCLTDCSFHLSRSYNLYSLLFLTFSLFLPTCTSRDRSSTLAYIHLAFWPSEVQALLLGGHPDQLCATFEGSRGDNVFLCRIEMAQFRRSHIAMFESRELSDCNSFPALLVPLGIVLCKIQRNEIDCSFSKRRQIF